MIVYVAMYRSDLKGWQPMMRAMTASTQRLCAYVNRDSAEKCIHNLKYRFSDDTDFRKKDSNGVIQHDFIIVGFRRCHSKKWL